VTPVVKQFRGGGSGTINGRESPPGIEIAIAKQFTFSSSMLRMSVICKTLNSAHMDVYTKGAPEKIAELCRPETSKTKLIDYFFVYLFM
jgi:magnesium-transporting ATPase (P-type)